MAVRYDFTAEVKPKTGPTLKLSKIIDVKRALPVSELPHHSVRIFPPTNIAASVHYPQIIHPIGSSTLQLRLDGIVKTNADVKTVEYWKLKRVSWKLEEHINTVAPSCAKHTPKDIDPASPDAASKKGVSRNEIRTIGAADLSSGWKSDYSPGGCVEMELDYQCAVNAKAACDMKTSESTGQVTHQLVVEMVVVQEYAPIAQPKHFTPTGIARILRMHFATTLTERAGLGVSWDNEAPPIYQDVPPSPPSYSCAVPFGEVESLSDLSDHSCSTCGRPSVEEAAPRYDE
jgi:arrestin-related trafficking adapter 1